MQVLSNVRELRVNRTCPSTSSPTFELADTKVLTSSSITLSKSSIDRGKGSIVGRGRIVVEEDCFSEGTELALVMAAIVEVCESSTAVAMSSRRDVAASKLIDARLALTSWNRRLKKGWG